jgi:hypothetical protein
MLNGGAHYSLEIEAELRIRPLPYFQRLEPAQDNMNVTVKGILVVD